MAHPLPPLQEPEMVSLSAAATAAHHAAVGMQLAAVHRAVSQYLRASALVTARFVAERDRRRAARSATAAALADAKPQRRVAAAHRSPDDVDDAALLCSGGLSQEGEEEEEVGVAQRLFAHNELFQRLLWERWISGGAASGEAARTVDNRRWDAAAAHLGGRLVALAKRALTRLVVPAVPPSPHPRFGFHGGEGRHRFLEGGSGNDGGEEEVVFVDGDAVIADGFVIQLWAPLRGGGDTGAGSESRAPHLGRLFVRSFAATVQQPTLGPPIHAPFSVQLSLLGFSFTATTPVPLTAQQLEGLEEATAASPPDLMSLERGSQFVREAADFLFASPAVSNTSAAPETLLRIALDGRCYALNTVCSHADVMPGKVLPVETLRAARMVAAKADAAHREGAAFDLRRAMGDAGVAMRFGGVVFQECRTERGRGGVLAELAARALRDVWTVHCAGDRNLLGTSTTTSSSSSSDNGNASGECAARFIALANRFRHVSMHDDAFWMICVLPHLHRRYALPKAVRLSVASISKQAVTRRFVLLAGLVVAAHAGDGGGHTVVTSVVPRAHRSSVRGISTAAAPVVVPPPREATAAHLRPANDAAHREKCRVTVWLNDELRTGAFREDAFQRLWKWLLVMQDDASSASASRFASFSAPPAPNGGAARSGAGQRNMLDVVALWSVLSSFVSRECIAQRQARGEGTVNDFAKLKRRDAGRVECLVGAALRIVAALAHACATSTGPRSPQRPRGVTAAELLAPMLAPALFQIHLQNLVALAQRCYSDKNDDDDGSAAMLPGIVAELTGRCALLAEHLAAVGVGDGVTSAATHRHNLCAIHVRVEHFGALAEAGEFHQGVMELERLTVALREEFEQSDHVTTTLRTFDMRLLLAPCRYFALLASAQGPQRTFVKATVATSDVRGVARWLIPVMVGWAAKQPHRIVDVVALYIAVGRTLLHAWEPAEAQQYLRAGLQFAAAYGGPTIALQRWLDVAVQRERLAPATVVQRAFRAHRAAAREQLVKLPPLHHIQRVGRAAVVRGALHLERECVRIQRVGRGAQVRAWCGRTCAAMVLQRVCRGWGARARAMPQQRVAFLQRIARAATVRRLAGWEHARRRSAAEVLLRLLRGGAARVHCGALRHWRACAVALLARVTNGAAARRRVARSAACFALQRVSRGLRRRRWLGFLRAVLQQAARTTQRCGRGALARHRLSVIHHHVRVRVRTAALSQLQRAARGYQQRVMLVLRAAALRRSRATMLLHRVMRGLYTRRAVAVGVPRQRLLTLRAAQRIGRGFIHARRGLERLHVACTHAELLRAVLLVQRVGRGRLRGAAALHALSALRQRLPQLLRLQRCGRGACCRRLELPRRHAERVRISRALLVLQAHLRVWWVCHELVPLQHRRRRNRAALFVQRVGRGCRARAAMMGVREAQLRRRLRRCTREAAAFQLSRVLDVVQLRRARAERLAAAKDRAVAVLEDTRLITAALGDGHASAVRGLPPLRGLTTRLSPLSALLTQPAPTCSVAVQVAPTTPPTTPHLPLPPLATRRSPPPPQPQQQPLGAVEVDPVVEG